MEPQKLNSLEGIIASESKALKAERSKNAFYREALGLHLGAEVPEGFSIMGTLNPQQLRSVEALCVFLEGEEGGADTLDSIFKDARNFEELSRQLSMIAALMQELDSIPEERDFPGRKEARSMLGSLSLSLKRTARLSAARPGRLTTW